MGDVTKLKFRYAPLNFIEGQILWSPNFMEAKLSASKFIRHVPDDALPSYNMDDDSIWEDRTLKKKLREILKGGAVIMKNIRMKQTTTDQRSDRAVFSSLRNSNDLQLIAKIQEPKKLTF